MDRKKSRNVSDYSLNLASSAKKSSSQLRLMTTAQKNGVLRRLSGLLLDPEQQKGLLHANERDIEFARENQLSSAMIDRLALTEKRIAEVARGVEEVVALPDPVGVTGAFRVLENGLRIGQIKVPLGVVLVIFESRPNVTIDVASLCIKSGNVAILRGGKEALHTNQAFFQLLGQAFLDEGFESMAFFVDKPDREIINELLSLDAYIDIVVPRGGYGLIQAVTEASRIPVIKHDAGICHMYVAADADLTMATEILTNAKTQRPGTCNAVETLLLDAGFAYKRELLESIRQHKVTLKGCSESQRILPGIDSATEEDYATEWLDLILNVRVVKNMDEAIAHIERYGSGHSEAIVSNHYTQIGEFMNRVDSAAVFVNCSTRFHDGGQFGLGAEVGISTQKLHVRGPMGLEHLTTTKYLVMGNGQVRG